MQVRESIYYCSEYTYLGDIKVVNGHAHKVFEVTDGFESGIAAYAIPPAATPTPTINANRPKRPPAKSFTPYLPFLLVACLADSDLGRSAGQPRRVMGRYLISGQVPPSTVRWMYNEETPLTSTAMGPTWSPPLHGRNARGV